MSSRHVLASVMSLWGVILYSSDTHAMSLDQMKMFAGTALLELRVDAVLSKCGLPSEILDPADIGHVKQKIRWGAVEMTLSPLEWDLIYTRRRDNAVRKSGWINPHSAGRACLAELSQLILHTKGAVGFLSVKKRTDNKGYLTSYIVPNSLYAAHQVIGLIGSWKQGMPITRIQDQYGNPDEVLDRAGGIKLYRYWVVAKDKEIPVSVHAIDFEVKDAEKICTKYTVQTSGFEFVQEKFDALLRQWERDYILD